MYVVCLGGLANVKTKTNMFLNSTAAKVKRFLFKLSENKKQK